MPESAFLDRFSDHFTAPRSRAARERRNSGSAKLLRVSGGHAILEVRPGGRPWYSTVCSVPLGPDGGPGPRPGICRCERWTAAEPCDHLWTALQALDGLRAAGALDEAIEEGHLQLLRSVGRGRDAATSPWTLAERAAERYTFDIDLDAPVGQDDVSLWLRRSTRKVDGSWSRGSNVRIDSLDLDAVGDDEGRELLLAISGRTGRFDHLTDPWNRDSNELQVPRAWAAEVIPRLAEQGRLTAIGEEEGRVELRWSPAAVRARAAVDEVGSGEDRRARLVVRASPEDGPLPAGAVLRVIADRFVAVGDVLHAAEPPALVALLAGTDGRRDMTVRAERRGELDRFLATLPPDAVVGAAIGAGASAAPPGTFVPHLHLLGSGDGRGHGGRVECEIHFEYEGAGSVQAGKRRQVVEGPDGQSVRRDLEAEARRLGEYLEVGGRRTQVHRDLGEDGTVPTRDVPSVVRRLLTRGWKVTAEGVRMRGASSTRASISSGVDWFEVHGGVDFDGTEVPFPELLKAVKGKQTSVVLGDGSRGVLPEDWLERVGFLATGEASGDAMRFPRAQGWLLDALLAERLDAQVDGGFEDYRARLRRFRKVRPRKEPAGFQGELRPYQRQALGWFHFLAQLGLGGCLADDMGLGKTVQVLAWILSRRRAREQAGGGRRPTLVVAPQSLVFNWADEAARFTPDLRVLVHTGPGRQERFLEAFADTDLVVTTYGVLRRDIVWMREAEFDYAVLDEATAIKNPSSQSAKAARLLQARHRLALTGTPVENDLGELWSLFEFLNPGMLGASSTFAALVSGSGAPEHVASIADAIQPFFLRRTKTEVLTELPDKSEQVLHVELPPRDRKRYDELKRHFQSELLGEGEDDGSAGDVPQKMHVLAALLRLRQAACHPALLDPALGAAASAKFDALLPRLVELAADGRKALVFSQFTTLLGLLQERLDAEGIAYESLTGRTRDRKARVERFQSDPDVPVFLISLKAGGHGLNLTSAEYVFLLDPWWNPAVEAQAVDRAHRMGQKRPVFACRIIARDTVEDRVLELQQSKRELAGALFDGRKGPLKGLTRQDLERLLG